MTRAELYMQLAKASKEFEDLIVSAPEDYEIIGFIKFSDTQHIVIFKTPLGKYKYHDNFLNEGDTLTIDLLTHNIIITPKY